MSVVGGYTQPTTGIIDFVFGGGLVLFALAVVSFFVWALSRLFDYVIPKTVGKLVPVKGKKK